MTKLPGKFVWFEHVSSDTAKARSFYEALCGWTAQAMPMGEQTYDVITNAGAGIGGYRRANGGEPVHWASYLSVDDVDRSFAAALAAGAKAVAPPMDFGPVGRGAVLTDPSGARLSLWRGAGDDPADAEKTPVGGWFWNELWSSDAKAALAFYRKVFGYSVDAMDMGAQGSYWLLKDATGAMRAGVMQQPPGTGVPSHWLPYIHVDDCDAASRKATALGAIKTVVPPTDIPDIGRFTVLIDPLGAPIALMKGAA